MITVLARLVAVLRKHAKLAGEVAAIFCSKWDLACVDLGRLCYGRGEGLVSRV